MKKLLMLIVVMALGAAVYANGDCCPPQDPGDPCVPPPWENYWYMPEFEEMPPCFTNFCEEDFYWEPPCSPCKFDMSKFNYASAWQRGMGNEAKQEQVGGKHNLAIVWQRGHDNYAKQYQEGSGDDNRAIIWQKGKENDAYQEQKGDDNLALILQQGAENYAKQTQDGEDNFACIKQMSPRGYRCGGFVDINDYAFQEQIGDDNVAIVHQFNSMEKGSDHNNKAYQYQDGDDNIAYIRQDFGYKNFAKQDQDGDDNTAVILQTTVHGRGGVVNPEDNEATQIQDGDDNKALTVQSSRDQYAKTTQIGDDNQATINQKRGEGNKAVVLQEGDDNFVGCMPCVETDCCRLLMRGEITWGVFQVGCDNDVDIKQFDDHNFAQVLQMGRDNESDVISEGYGVVRVQQRGHDNKSWIHQH
ncbi:hypothetical protein EYV94_06480 [Puteibacter caeruleilacunae]|nr:hypothetical protein EYV94_06480 [Puteibacter caeruleilacunae]